MAEYRIFTDATADLSPELQEGLPPIEVIPMQVEIGGKEYTYGSPEGITAQEFYRLQREGNFASTSQINPAAYFQYFEPWLRQGTDILYLCFSSGLSGTYQSASLAIEELKAEYPGAEINPLGDWSGGTDVDSGATNRKLGSDMADSVTGGGLHGKDLSKADVSVNIYAWLKAQETGVPVEYCCAIGDECIDGIPYEEIVKTARAFINKLGGFERFAEWGLV